MPGHKLEPAVSFLILGKFVKMIPIKLGNVHEARIALEDPGAADSVRGVPLLTPLDMAASKLLANSDRWPDGDVFSRDRIDLAVMQPALPLLLKRNSHGPATPR